MKGFALKFILPVICLLLVASTFFINERLSAISPEDAVSQVEILEQGQGAVFEKQNDAYILKSGAAAALVLVLNSNSIIRLDKGSDISLKFIENDDFSRTAEVGLFKGRIWIYTLNSSLKTELKTPSLQVLAEPGVFDIQYIGGNLTLTALRHNIDVEILGNKLVVPESRSMVISEEKIKNSADTIKKLRYSKLLKEFPYFAVSKPDAWIVSNQKKDSAFLEKYKESLFEDIRNGGVKLGADEDSFFFKFNKFLRDADVEFTFDPSRKIEKQTSTAFKYFDSGVYAVLTGNETLAIRRFEQFSFVASEMDSALKDASQSWNKSLEKHLDLLAFARPNDKFFQAKSALRLASKTSGFDSLHLAYADILDTAAIGNDAETGQKVITALRRFGSQADFSLKRMKGDLAATDAFFTSIYLNEFLKSRPGLLKNEFLRISELFERFHLAGIGNREQTDDQRQFFIADKIKIIQMVKALIEADTVQFQDGRNSILLLANQIEALKPTFSDTAVLSYFDKQLADLAPFITFLRSSTAERIHGSYQEGFEDFKKQQAEFKQVAELLSTAAGGEQISASRREELAGIVAADIGSLGIKNIKITLPAVEGDSRVNVVNAEFEGKKFTGVYDTVRKVMSDIVFDSEKIPNSVKSENLKKLFLIKMGKLALATGETVESLTEQPSQESILEKVTTAKLLEDLDKMGISVDEKYLGMENFGEGVIHVRLALLGDGSDATVFAFDVAPKISTVSNLKVQTVSGELPVNGTFSLRELALKVDQVFKAAAFEKQKEDELKKFVNGGAAEEGTSSVQRQ